MKWTYDAYRDGYTTSPDWRMEVGDYLLHRTDTDNWHLMRCKVDGWYTVGFYRTATLGKPAAEAECRLVPVLLV